MSYTLRDGLDTELEEELVEEVASVMDVYLHRPPLDRDVVAKGLLAARAWRERQAYLERQHVQRSERIREETRAILAIAEARDRARAHYLGG